MVSVLLKAFQGPRHPIPLPFAVDQVVDEPQKINGDLPVNKNQKWSVREYISVKNAKEALNLYVLFFCILVSGQSI